MIKILKKELVFIYLYLDGEVEVIGGVKQKAANKRTFFVPRHISGTSRTSFQLSASPDAFA